MTGVENPTPPTRPWLPPKDTKFRRRLIYARHLLKRAFRIRRGYTLSTLGETSTGCSWTFCPDGLGRDSIVYSGGVGKDISFEHALAKKFGCVIHLLDPSPTGLATMDRVENQVPEFRFFQVGLAGGCGKLHLSPPLNDKEGSWVSNQAGGTLETPCVDLRTLLEQNHHHRVDLLKL